MKSHPHLESMWKGAIYAVAMAQTNTEAFAGILRQLGENEARAHLDALHISAEGVIASGSSCAEVSEL